MIRIQVIAGFLALVLSNSAVAARASGPSALYDLNDVSDTDAYGALTSNCKPAAAEATPRLRKEIQRDFAVALDRYKIRRVLSDDMSQETYRARGGVMVAIGIPASILMVKLGLAVAAAEVLLPLSVAPGVGSGLGIAFLASGKSEKEKQEFFAATETIHKTSDFKATLSMRKQAIRRSACDPEYLRAVVKSAEEAIFAQMESRASQWSNRIQFGGPFETLFRKLFRLSEQELGILAAELEDARE